MKKFGAIVLLLAIIAAAGYAWLTYFPSEPLPEHLRAALANDARPEAERDDDRSRQPGAVLGFAGLQPGMAVFEMEAGGGYYTAIMAHAVGPEGSVVMQNPAPFDSFYQGAPQQRAEGLANVRYSATNFDELDAADGSMDLVTWILGPHELWFEPEGVNFGDPAGSFAEIARILKPGGAALLIDHHAAADAGTEVGGTLHRIGEAVIHQLAEDAGLSLHASSPLLENTADPLDINVFDDSIRRNTSRFMLLYSK